MTMTATQASGSVPTPPASSGAGARGRLEYPRRRILAARVASVAVVVTGLVYMTWRLSTLSGTGVLGLAFYAVEALNFAVLVGTVALFWRLRQRSGPSASPFGTLDVFVPVCGEPVGLVEDSLRAALAISYPHETYLLNDGRIADAANWRAVEELARRYGVPCFTRRAGSRGKAGNLNHALAQTTGDFVAVIDCDHRAELRFAHETIGYFADPKVGFVTTRQDFVGDRADVLGTREPLFFTWSQPAKDAADAAFSTGSAVVYRRSALTSAEGFSEWSIVEDLHTSMRIHQQGWTSVYHGRPVTIGIAPQTASALVKQRLTWATDSTRVFFWDNPLLKKGLTFRQKLHYLHTTSYFLVATTQVFFIISPALWLIWDVSVMRPSSTASYVAYNLPFVGSIGALIVAYGGWRGIRAVQQQLYLAPVYAVGVLRAATGVRFGSGVTEKLLQSRFSPLTVPQIAAATLLAVAIGYAVANPGPGQAAAAAWAGFMAYSLASFAATVTRRSAVDRALRVTLRTAIVLGVAAIVLPLGVRERAGAVPEAAQAWTGPRLALAPPRSGAYLGVFSPGLPERAGALAAWNREHGAAARVVHWYQQWFDGDRELRADWLATVATQDAVPMISWEPRGLSGPPSRDRGVLGAIARGEHDAFIRSWARTAASYGRPLLLRPMHDMNGTWYPWSARSSPTTFVAAWRRMHDLFLEEGATNVGWVWSVYSLSETRAKGGLADFYPGRPYVDWVSMAGFNWGPGSGRAWRTLDDLFASTYEALTRFGKPVMISQIATGEGGDRAAWVREGLTRLRTSYPRVKAVVWFDTRYSTEIDFSLRGPAAAALRREVGASRYWRPAPRIVRAGGARGGSA